MRLTREERRTQLVQIGMRLVTASSFDAVSVDDVAEEAGISRSLLFHYFPTKHDFQVAVAVAATEDLLEATRPDPDLPAMERLRTSLAAYIDYVAHRRDAFLSMVRGASGASHELRAVVNRAHEEVAERILEGLEIAPDEATPFLRVAVHGWIGFMEESVMRWLAEDMGSRERLIDLIETVLVQALLALHEHEPAHLDSDGTVS